MPRLTKCSQQSTKGIVMMSGESAAVHKRNLESSILFMQQEHASTLKALHDEIASLQKRCTDLTFQLTMHGLTIEESSNVDSQMQQVQQELQHTRTKLASLESQVIERDKKIERLEADAKSQRKRFLEESRSHSQITNSLKAELEAKSNNIAYLTTELHRLKQKSRTDGGVANPGAISNPGGTSCPPGSYTQPSYLHPEQPPKTQTHHHFVPAPPQRERSTLGPGSSTNRVRRPGHSKPSSSHLSRPLAGGGASHPKSADGLPTRHHTTTNQLRLSSGNRSSGSESPDITPFIQQAAKDEDVHVNVKQPLPPILTSNSKSVPGAVGAKPVLVHQVLSSTSQKKPSPSTTEASIVTLAVGNAASDNPWSLAQQNRSTE